MNANVEPSLEREREILLGALERPSPRERAAFLDAACGDDAPLRALLESLLRCPVNDGFLEDLPVDLKREVRSEPAVMEGPGTVIGRYQLLRKLGEGGMGVVYMAEQAEPVRRHVALKIIKVGMDTRKVVARFEAERQALALMDHPNIARVVDAGATTTGRPYFVMELVQGLPITEFCDQHQLTTHARLDLFIQVCHAIQHAHQKGIIHRDIKPSNILVTLLDGTTASKVIDFGIAKAVGGQLTGATVFTLWHHFIGTPAYMSPEQAAGVDTDTRSDIYSLGVLLYELLTGRPLFDGKELLAKGLDAMRRTIREQEPMRPSTRLATLSAEEMSTAARQRSVDPPKLVRQVRGDLDWIVMKCLEKDRERRYLTASGLGVDVQRHLGNEPVVARPPSNWYRFQKTARRHKTVFAAGAVVLAALVAGLGFSSWSYFNERQMRQRAVTAEQAETLALQAADLARSNAQAQALLAETKAPEARMTLANSHFLQAALLIEQAKDDEAVAHLTACLRLDPAHQVAGVRLATLLAGRSWPLPLTEPLRHTGQVVCAEFSRDGGRLVTAGFDKTARIWDAQTGRALAGPLSHTEVVNPAQFSPDGRRVLTASRDKRVRIWDAQTGQPLTEPLQHADAVSTAQFSLDGTRVLTASNDGAVRAWDAQTGQPLAELLTLPHPQPIQSARFSRDGKRIVTRSLDFTARVWDVQTGLPLSPSFKHTNLIDSAEFSPDGNRVVTASTDHTARVWDALTGQPLTAPLEHLGRVALAFFSPDGKRVVTASVDHTARVWDAQTGQPLTGPLRHVGNVQSARFSPDGSRVVTASLDHTARVWDAQTGRPLTPPLRHPQAVLSALFDPQGMRVATLAGTNARVWDVGTSRLESQPLIHDTAVAAAQFSPDGRQVLTVSAEDTARLWDARTGQPAFTEPLRHGGQVASAQFSRDGKRVVTASDDGTARVWEAQTGRPLSPPIQHAQRVVSAQFSPDGERVVTASWDHTARVWDARTGQPVTRPLQHEDRVNSARFSEDGKWVATASADKTARVWDARTGQCSIKPLNHTGPVRSAQFSPDGERVVTASNDGTAQVWETRTGLPLTEPLSHDGWVPCAQFSPDGKWIVTASLDHTARVWDARTGLPLTEPLRHASALSYAQSSPDGKWVVTASLDHTARVWDARTGLPLTEPLEHAQEVRFAQFSPDGTRVVTASDDGTARVWDVAPASTQCPDWFLHLAEVVAGRTLNRQGGLQIPEAEPFAALRDLQRELGQAPGDEGWAVWARWLLADRATRTISPFSKMTK